MNPIQPPGVNRSLNPALIRRGLPLLMPPVRVSLAVGLLAARLLASAPSSHPRSISRHLPRVPREEEGGAQMGHHGRTRGIREPKT